MASLASLLIIFGLLKAADIALSAHRNARLARWRAPTNKQGWRADFDYSDPRIQGMRRAAVVGDSFAYGWGVDWNQTFSKRAFDSLNNGASHKWEALNFGAYGVGPMKELETLERILPRYRPDIVIWQFYINDIGGLHDGLQRNKASADISAWKTPPSPIFMYNIKQAFHAFFPSLYLSTATGIRRIYGRLFKDRRTVFNDPDYMYRQWGGLYSPEELPRIEKDWISLEQILIRAAAVSERYNARFLVLFIPAEAEVSDAYREELEKRFLYHIDKNAAESRYAHKRLALFLTQHRIELLDMLDDFRNHADPSALYLHGDFHLTPTGHAIIARRLAAMLARH